MAIGTALAIGAGLSAAGSVASGIIGANAASDAAAMQGAAAKKANKVQKKMYNSQIEAIEPWRQAGLGALEGMQDQDFQRDFSMADFQADPGYAFRMGEASKALERSAAARGGLNSGAFVKALTRYNQDAASQEYQSAYDRFNNNRSLRFGRLSTIAGYGQNATGQLMNASQNYANQYGSNVMGAANAQGASKIAGANAIGGAIQGVAGAGMDAISMGQQQSWMDKWLAKQG
jgi:hypothetical protein